MASEIDRYSCDVCCRVVLPEPDFSCENKSLTAEYGYQWPNTVVGVPTPTTCSERWSKWGKITDEYAYSVNEPAPSGVTDSEGFETLERRIYVGTYTVTREKNPFTGDVTLTFGGTGSFRNEQWSSDEVTDPGDPNYQKFVWRSSEDFWEEWYISPNGTTGGGFDWSFENDDSDTDSGTITGDNDIAPQNIKGDLDLAGFGAFLDLDTSATGIGWTGPSYESETDECAMSFTLGDEWSFQWLEEQADDAWDDETWAAGDCEASRSATYASVSGGCTAEDHIDTWTETLLRYQWEVDSGWFGEYFRIDWDELEELDGEADSTSADSWEWNDPASKVSDWTETEVSGSGLGTVSLVNVRFIGWSTVDAIPQYHGSFEIYP